MSYILITVARCTCDRPQCGKPFTSRTAEPPDRCPYCGSRKWDVKGLQEVGAGVSRNSVEDKAVRTESRGSGRAAKPQRKTESSAADVSDETPNELTYEKFDEL